MSNVNFLNILKEEKQRILKLHENAGYKNTNLTEKLLLKEDAVNDIMYNIDWVHNHSKTLQKKDYMNRIASQITTNIKTIDDLQKLEKAYKDKWGKSLKVGFFVNFISKGENEIARNILTALKAIKGVTGGYTNDSEGKYDGKSFTYNYSLTDAQNQKDLRERIGGFPVCVQKLANMNFKTPAKYTPPSNGLPEGITITYDGGQVFYYSRTENIVMNKGYYKKYKCDGDKLEMEGDYVKTLSELTGNQTTDASSNDSGKQQAASSQGGDKNSSGGSVKNTNYVSNTQTSLENAGFSVGSKGADGRVGSDTLTAINQLISKYSELATKQ